MQLIVHTILRSCLKEGLKKVALGSFSFFLKMHKGKRLKVEKKKNNYKAW